MAKIVDITEKLAFDENPRILIKGKKYEVNADAESVLKIMGILGNGGTAPKDVVEMYQLIFPEKERKNIAKLKLKFTDFQTLVLEAINLITGDDGEDQGE